MDLLTVIERMILQRGVESVRIFKVKGHADEDMVAVGRVRVEEKVGNDFADRAADFGRRRVSDLVMDVRRRFVSACSFWYPLLSWMGVVSSLPVLSMRMGVLGLLCILLFGQVVVFRWLSCLFCTTVGLVKGLCWRCLFLSSVGLIVQFQCRLFLRDGALIFGDLAGFWVPCFGL